MEMTIRQPEAIGTAGTPSQETVTTQDLLVKWDIDGHARAADAHRLLEEVRQTLRQHDGDIDIVLNLKNVQSVDSAMLGALSAIYAEMALNRGRIIKLPAVEAGGTVKKLLDLAKIDELYEWHPTEEAAIESITADTSSRNGRGWKILHGASLAQRNLNGFGLPNSR